MSQPLEREISAQESTVNQNLICHNEEILEERYECPICMNWLNEPNLTSCGHRFCKNCISSWLRKENAACPVCHKLLKSEDIFPDNYTRREIQQIRKNCPNTGCNKTSSPLEMDGHMLECEFRMRTLNLDCPFKQCGCNFSSTKKDMMENHTTSDYQEHLSLLMTAFCQSQDMKMWDAPKKSANGNGNHSNSDELVRGMYERIVFLEQQQREQDLKIVQLTQQMQHISQGYESRYSGGVLLWKITDFHNKIEAMKANPNIMYYSGKCYTSVHGYKFCCRINISPKVKDFFGVFVHLMKSENDFHLDWPFKGRIKISMIHMINLLESQTDVIMSKPEILAFSRPMSPISPRGFGFLEFASLIDIYRRGFVVDDTLVIKVQLNIV